jgi:hypothetical protein
MIGEANRTNGIIITQAKAQDLSQWPINNPLYINGPLAIPAAIAHVNPDWINPNRKWL